MRLVLRCRLSEAEPVPLEIKPHALRGERPDPEMQRRFPFQKLSLGFLIAFLLLFSLMRGNRRRWMEHAAGESRESLIPAQ